MNKAELIQAIADKTSLDPDIINKVIDACESILIENAQHKNWKLSEFTRTSSFKEN